jgi:hypothetical protein
MVLLEDRLQRFLGHADAGVPDLNAQAIAAPAAADQDLAFAGVLHRVGE